MTKETKEFANDKSNMAHWDHIDYGLFDKMIEHLCKGAFQSTCSDDCSTGRKIVRIAFGIVAARDELNRQSLERLQKEIDRKIEDSKKSQPSNVSPLRET